MFLLTHPAAVNRCSYSPDGQRIATASEDNTAAIWDATTGEPVPPPLLRRAMVGMGVWSCDDREVSNCSYDGTARAWDVSPTSAPLEELQRQVELLSAHCLMLGIGTVPLSASEMQERWQARRGWP